MTPSPFTDKVAVITGAGTGIGFQIARQLALKGAKIVLNDINADAANKARNAIKKEGGNIIIVVGDSSDIQCIQNIVDTAVATFGKLDLAIANAGITTFGSFLDYPIERFQQLVDVNLKGTFYLAQRAALQIIKQKSKGSILLLSSVTGHQVHPDLTAYGMSKAAIRHLAKSLGVELAPYSISVNAISPGATLTERTIVLENGDYERIWNKITPTKRAATTEDIAQAALFLLSPQSSQITGQTLIVDGGWTATSPSPS